MRTCALLLSLVIFFADPTTTCAIAQKSANKHSESLSTKQSYAPVKGPIFTGDGTTSIATLSVSWIPGPDRKGVMRYQSTIVPLDDPAFAGSDAKEQTSKYLKRINNCRVFLELEDKDGFIIRDIEADYSLSVTSDGHVGALNANGSEPLSADEYRMFMSGNWSVSWSKDC